MATQVRATETRITVTFAEPFYGTNEFVFDNEDEVENILSLPAGEDRDAYIDAVARHEVVAYLIRSRKVKGLAACDLAIEEEVLDELVQELAATLTPGH